MPRSLVFYQCSILTTTTDSEDQKKEWQDNPDKHAEYCRDVEGELNKRFTLVSLSFLPGRCSPSDTL